MSNKEEKILLKVIGAVKKVGIVLIFLLIAIIMVLSAKNRNYLPDFMADLSYPTTITTNWKSTIIPSAILAIVVVLISIVSVRKMSDKKSETTGADTTHTTTDASASTTPKKKDVVKTKRSFGWLWWIVGLSMIVLVVGAVIVYLMPNVLKRNRDITSQNTQKIAPSQSRTTFSPPEKRRLDVTINKKWTALPKSVTGKYHFVLTEPWVKCKVRCMRYLPDGNKRSIGEYDFGGKAGTNTPFPTCDEIQMLTINSDKAVITWWEE